VSEYTERTSSTPTLAQRVPFDLFAVLLWTVATLFLVVSGDGASPVRIVVGLGFVLLAPGYAIVSALFPAKPPTYESPFDDAPIASVRVGERFVLSLGLSVFSVPLAGILLSFSPLGVDPTTVVPLLALTTVAATVVAAYRRTQLPVADRFGLRVGTWLADARRRTTGSDGVDSLLNVLLVVGLVLAVAGIGVGLVTVENGERFTEFGVLTTDDGTGELVAEGYPDTFARGETTPLTLSVTNNEGREVEYTIVAELQRVDEDGSVVETSELDRIETTVGAGERWQTEHRVEPTMTGEDLRLTYLLYTDDVPEAPSTENAYRHLHLWVDVE
jgi:uncharacterized membrane protein